jgi:hypothetical protein
LFKRDYSHSWKHWIKAVWWFSDIRWNINLHAWLKRYLIKKRKEAVIVCLEYMHVLTFFAHLDSTTQSFTDDDSWQ